MQTWSGEIRSCQQWPTATPGGVEPQRLSAYCLAQLAVAARLLAAMANTCAVQQVLFMGSNRKPSYVTGCSPLLSANDLGPGEVLVRIICAAICPMDLEILANEHLEQELPSGLGHEGVGEIVATKRTVTGEDRLVPGDRIIFCSSLCSDHEIPDPRCSQSIPSSKGAKKLHFGGTFSSHCILKRDAHLLKLPDSIPSTVGAIVNCSLAAMTFVLTTTLPNLNVRIDESSRNAAIIQGTTVRGLYSCAFLRQNGYGVVIVVERTHSKWNLIKDFGGTPTSSLSEDSQINSILQDKRVSLIIDTDHCQHFCASALDMLSSKGVYILAGTTRCDLMQLPTRTIITKNLTIKGAHNYRAQDLKTALIFLEETKRQYPYESLVLGPFPFSNFNEAISLAANEQVKRVLIQTTKICGSAPQA